MFPRRCLVRKAGEGNTIYGKGVYLALCSYAYQNFATSVITPRAR
ncbi:hypothetical protein HMPREF9442_00886 [Paraprevotella xylaniphila YIT 11841]|uniref:Uncharacterized protein n=1 Tax=Paraprevotella xylaniphila YIT 11841 TaxID=762982 RepID=F3QRX0_9BACT|nr:hypothetical protein HMPREF9442_00886 [Paraprevotella xylaniphila YIT 11841]